MGSVGQPGFHQLDAEMLLSDALTAAGGISNNTDLPRSKILRDDLEIIGGEEFARGITEGVSLDQLNLRAGDVIEVGTVSKQDWFTTTRTILAVPALIVSIYGLGRLFDIW
jgi:protein involved in polysaccharide export with SLBB domain